MPKQAGTPEGIAHAQAMGLEPSDLTTVYGATISTHPDAGPRWFATWGALADALADLLAEEGDLTVSLETATMTHAEYESLPEWEA